MHSVGRLTTNTFTTNRLSPIRVPQLTTIIGGDPQVGNLAVAEVAEVVAVGPILTQKEKEERKEQVKERARTGARSS